MAKRLMFLGAGPSQMPGIRTAVKLGLHVITVDYLPENPGHRLSHEYVNCSTVDQDAVVRAAAKARVDGVMTFASDVATGAVAATAQALQLPGGNLEAAKTMSNKASFRRFQEQNGLRHPRFVVAADAAAMQDGIRKLQPPFVFKPVDTSGSRGVSVVSDPSSATVQAAFAKARSFSRSETVCVEEFVAGIEVGGDGFMSAGRLHCMPTHKHKQGLIPAGHSLPANISGEDIGQVRAELEATCQALGYTHGPLNFDVVVAPAGMTVLEMSPRLGGNGIPAVIARATGTDLTEAAVRFAVGEFPEFPAEFRVRRACGSLVLGSDRGGILRGFTAPTELTEEVPQVFEAVVFPQPGAAVKPFRHSGNSFGYVLFDCPESAGGYETLAARVRQAIRLDIA